jgi:hypothetical protein
MSQSYPQSKTASDQSKTPSVPAFPLKEMPKNCWANEHSLHRTRPFSQRLTWTFNHPKLGEITRPYYVCTTCVYYKTNIFRNCGYPRDFITWDDNIGLHPDNPRCYCGCPSRQDRKGSKYPLGFGDGFWICASGACWYYSDRRDGVPYEDAKRWLDDDEFRPWLLEGIPPFP